MKKEKIGFLHVTASLDRQKLNKEKLHLITILTFIEIKLIINRKNINTLKRSVIFISLF